MMEISIIVPVYNGAKYLPECLDSLARQNFVPGRHEVIIVNDGSTDNTEAIIDDYCARFDYMRKINKPNGGVSSARNAGIQLVTGGGTYASSILMM